MMRRCCRNVNGAYLSLVAAARVCMHNPEALAADLSRAAQHPTHRRSGGGKKRFGQVHRDGVVRQVDGLVDLQVAGDARDQQGLAA